MDFTVTITDKAKLLGIAEARNRKNAAIHVTDDAPLESHEDYLASDQDYVQWVMDKAAESYSKKHQTTEAEIDAKIADLQALKAQIK